MALRLSDSKGKNISHQSLKLHFHLTVNIHCVLLAKMLLTRDVPTERKDQKTGREKRERQRG